MKGKDDNKWIFRILKWFCPAHLYEEIEGDLIQRFNRDLISDVSETSKVSDAYRARRAKRRLLWNAIQFLRPGIILRNRFTIEYMQFLIYSNYLKMGVRRMAKRKVHSFITVFGLALGLAICLVIRQYVEFERSYDSFHKNSDLIYRAVFTGYENGEKNYFSPRFGYGLGPSLKEDMPEIASFVRTREQNAIIGFSDQSGNAIQFEEEIQLVDSTFFEVFTYEALYGNLSKSLDNTSSIVLTQSAAQKYFGEASIALGKSLLLSTQYEVNGAFEVTAVIKDVPDNAHLQFDFLIPIDNLLRTSSYSEPGAQWDWVNFITYVLVHPGSSAEAMNSKTDALLTKYTGPNPPGSFVFTFQPLKQIHLSEQEENLFSSAGFLMLLALFILTIAWINFINLSTARAIERAKEVGVKKAMGVMRTQLVSQFMTESVLINFLSVVLAVIMARGLLPLLSEMIGKSVTFDFSSSAFWITIGIVWIGGSLISGIYPAFVLSSFNTIQVLKGRVQSPDSGISFRKGLIVFQFASSLVLIVGALAIYKQIRFMQMHEKGMNINQMLIVEAPKIIETENIEQQLLSFKNEISNNSFVQNITSSGSTPGNGYSLVTGMTRVGAEENPNQRETIYVVEADPDFVKTYDIQLLSGRTWNEKMTSDSKSVLVNETSLSLFDLGDAANALNEKVIIDGTDTVSILGVFKDVHWNSLHTANIPLLIKPQLIVNGQFSIQLNGSFDLAISEIEKSYKKAFPGNPFGFYFLDDFFDQQYKADRQFGKLILFFATLAIIIACLGLWGLASFTTLQRMKEISIRKISGASITNIITLLSNDYLKLLALAVFIALPAVGYGINEWLSSYAFRMSITPDLLIVPVVLLLLIMMITVSLQIVKAALTNPIESLKND